MKTLRVSALALVLLLATGLSGCLLVPLQYAISGNVTNSDTGLGIAGATVSFSGGFTPVITGEDGTWVKGGLRGTVTVMVSAHGYSFSPDSAIVKCAELDVDFIGTPAIGTPTIETVFWYSAPDWSHFFDGMVPIQPTTEITSASAVTVEKSSQLTAVPQGFDVLVLSDTGAAFDITDFEGQVIVTLDSSISPLFYWLTGSTGRGEYWDNHTSGTLTWVTPALGTEPGFSDDSRIFHGLDTNLPIFTRRNDLLEAHSTSGADDIVIYQITTDDSSWWWVHVGPAHIAAARTSDIIRYALDVIKGVPSELDAYAGSTARTAATVGRPNN